MFAVFLLASITNYFNMMDLLNVLLISLLAGLCTAIGGAFVMIKKPGPKSSGFLFGFAAGVMITVALAGLLMETWGCCGIWMAVTGFGLGAVFMFIIDVLLPHTRFGRCEKGIENRMLAAGTMLTIGIAIHNLPEGIAVGAGFMHAPAFGIFIAVAIALHNIPEGIATALPIYIGSKSRKMAFKFAFLSGIVEPAGAMLAAFFLTGFKSLVPLSLAFAGGVMFFITLDELLPCAQCSCHEHATSIGIIGGAVMMLVLMGVFGI